jgi:hypothetical protein
MKRAQGRVSALLQARGASVLRGSAAFPPPRAPGARFLGFHGRGAGPYRPSRSSLLYPSPRESSPVRLITTNLAAGKDRSGRAGVPCPTRGRTEAAGLRRSARRVGRLERRLDTLASAPSPRRRHRQECRKVRRHRQEYRKDVTNTSRWRARSSPWRFPCGGRLRWAGFESPHSPSSPSRSRRPPPPPACPTGDRNRADVSLATLSPPRNKGRPDHGLAPP